MSTDEMRWNTKGKESQCKANYAYLAGHPDMTLHFLLLFN